MKAGMQPVAGTCFCLYLPACPECGSTSQVQLHASAQRPLPFTESPRSAILCATAPVNPQSQDFSLLHTVAIAKPLTFCGPPSEACVSSRCGFFFFFLLFFLLCDSSSSIRSPCIRLSLVSRHRQVSRIAAEPPRHPSTLASSLARFFFPTPIAIHRPYSRIPTYRGIASTRNHRISSTRLIRLLADFALAIWRICMLRLTL
ncbi:hypothetical protein ACQKWADRAFT_171570 [Trichoderma austrokoningii]